MFGLFTKTKSKGKGEKFDYGILATDMHSHILPGIDDGSPDLDTSLELIAGMRELGYRKLIATPHILWDMYRNTPEIIAGRLDVVRSAVAAAGIDIQLEAAAEYFLDEHVDELLSQKQPLLTLDGRKVLVEFSMAFPPFNIKDTLFELQMQGYEPIIVHPERYQYLLRNKGYYDELRELGCLFQLNILSLSGQYGKGVTELAHYLLRKNYYDLLGTDLHHTHHLDGLRNLSVSQLPEGFPPLSRFINNQL